MPTARQARTMARSTISTTSTTKTDQFNISAAKFSINHDPDPVGAHVDLIYGRTNDFINAAASNQQPPRPISSTTSSRHSSALKPLQGQGLRIGLRQIRLRPPALKCIRHDGSSTCDGLPYKGKPAAAVLVSSLGRNVLGTGGGRSAPAPGRFVSRCEKKVAIPVCLSVCLSVGRSAGGVLGCGDSSSHHVHEQAMHGGLITITDSAGDLGAVRWGISKCQHGELGRIIIIDVQVRVVRVVSEYHSSVFNVQC